MWCSSSQIDSHATRTLFCSKETRLYQIDSQNTFNLVEQKDQDFPRKSFGASTTWSSSSIYPGHHLKFDYYRQCTWHCRNFLKRLEILCWTSWKCLLFDSRNINWVCIRLVSGSFDLEEKLIWWICGPFNDIYIWTDKHDPHYEDCTDLGACSTSANVHTCHYRSHHNCGGMRLRRLRIYSSVSIHLFALFVKALHTYFIVYAWSFVVCAKRKLYTPPKCDLSRLSNVSEKGWLINKPPKTTFKKAWNIVLMASRYSPCELGSGKLSRGTKCITVVFPNGSPRAPKVTLQCKKRPW